MIKVAILAVFLCSLANLGYAQTLGYCKLVGTSSNTGLSGYVTFVQVGQTVNMTVYATGVNAPSKDHGIHVHEFGDLTMTNGTSVGNHYNPEGLAHGCPPSTTRHLGDTGNWAVDANGVIDSYKVLDLLTLTGNTSIIGRAVVIHANTDDCALVNSSMARYGYCVIGVRNPTKQDASYTTNNAVSGAVTVTTAVCNLVAINSSGVSGLVYFSQANPSSAVVVTAMIDGLAAGSKHGFHIHEFGDLSDNTAGLSVGGHFNPTNGSHSLPGEAVNYHLGDMGNIYHYVGATAYYKYSNTKISLSGTNNVIGRAVVVHSSEDVCTMPSSGSRMSFCVIGISGSFSSLDIPADVPTTQSTTACAPATSSQTSTTGPASSASNNEVVAPFVFALLVALMMFV